MLDWDSLRPSLLILAIAGLVVAILTADVLLVLPFVVPVILYETNRAIKSRKQQS